MKRGIIIGVVAIVAVLGIGVFVLYSSLGDLIKAAVEKVGSEATQASVTLDSVDLDATSGKGALRGFKVGNPKGFETPAAFTLGSVSLHVDAGTVTSDPVVIKEIVIDKPEVTYELGGSGSNIDAIQKNVDAYAKQFASSGSKSEGGGPKIVIENLYVRGGKVNVSASILQGKAMGASLPDIHLKDIGKDKGGASPADVAKQVIDSMTSKIGGAMSSIGVGKTLDSLQKTLTGSAGKAVEEITKQGEDAKGAIEEGVGAAGDKLKKLLGN